MDRMERLKERLAREYGIETEGQLLEALEKDRLDIGIFTMPLKGKEGQSA